MNRMYLIYKIENIKNKKIYIGCHVTENIKDKYMGSGTNIRKEIKKYGIDNFEKSILYCFDNEKEMLEKERELVNREFISREDTYNIIIGGGNFLTIDTICVKDKNGNCFRVHKNDPRYLSGDLVGVVSGFVPVKDKNGNTLQISRFDERFLSGELIHVTANLVTVKDKNGNTFSIDKNDPRYLCGELKYHWNGRKHKQETKEKIGLKNSILQKGEKNSQFGTCWVKKDNENRKIKKELLEDYINNGWIKGRIIKC